LNLPIPVHFISPILKKKKKDVIFITGGWNAKEEVKRYLE